MAVGSSVAGSEGEQSTQSPRRNEDYDGCYMEVLKAKIALLEAEKLLGEPQQGDAVRSYTAVLEAKIALLEAEKRLSLAATQPEPYSRTPKQPANLTLVDKSDTCNRTDPEATSNLPRASEENAIDRDRGESSQKVDDGQEIQAAEAGNAVNGAQKSDSKAPGTVTDTVVSTLSERKRDEVLQDSKTEDKEDTKIAANDESSGVSGEKEGKLGADAVSETKDAKSDEKDVKGTDDSKTESKENKGDEHPKTDEEDTKAGAEPTKDKDESATQETKRIRNVTTKWNSKNSKWEDEEDSTKSEEVKDAPEKPATFRRRMDVDNEKRVDFEEVEIVSQGLKELIAETDMWWRNTMIDSRQPVTVKAPFHPFVRAWDNYIAACKPVNGDNAARSEARKDLESILERIEHSHTLESYFRYRDTILTSKRIKFEFLWTLFGHGARVYARPFLDEIQMLEVKSCSEPPYKGRRFRVSCSAFDWDGTRFSNVGHDFFIKEFSDERFIDSLEIFPTEYYSAKDTTSDEPQIRQQLVQRGKRYAEICTGEPYNFQCEYQGKAVVSLAGLHGLRSGRVTENNLLYAYDPELAGNDLAEMAVTPYDLTSKRNRVIIDNWSFLNSKRNPTPCGDLPPLGKKVSYYQSPCVCGICEDSPLQKWRRESRTAPNTTDSGTKFAEDEARLMFLPPRLLGFALEQKFWGQFLVDKITPTEFREDSEQANPFWKEHPFWKDLQLEKEAKERLMSFVTYHACSRLRRSDQEVDGKDNNSFDVIEGKGQGLAIMLHGPPGVGKTLTAETIALATGRPLLTVSVAEIGVEPQEAEQKLSEVFADAARWQAVLLMDEADVFVEERQKGELSRNALVSVLLRCLEYYEGIIIMTTNRVKSIDIAVQSRIHLAIQYPDLTPHQRIEIYKNRLKCVPDEEIGTKEDRDALENHLERQSTSVTKKANKADGRQIRNIVMGARALAKGKGEKLTINHLVTVDETTSEFIRAMEDLNTRHRLQQQAAQ